MPPGIAAASAAGERPPVLEPFQAVDFMGSGAIVMEPARLAGEKQSAESSPAHSEACDKSLLPACAS